MLEPRGGADLTEETLATQGRPQIGMEHLYGDIAVVPDVVRQINSRHATLADLSFYAVAISESVSESRVQSVHRCMGCPLLEGGERLIPDK